MWLRAAGVSVVIGIGACGGVVERESKEGPQAPPDDPAPAQAASDPGGAGWDAATPLDSCMTGFVREEAPDRPCNWVVGDRCYEEKLEACACACPDGTAVSTCSSGFPEPDGAVEVYCF